ncbi:MAG: calcium-translocating P-type ATPase, PMCA-type [Prevotellaceae bacterium]|jgi:Ca2+-transporting ATPase|nr:calcium-translocating P-type ATPase, PMCA-type [Prevotellaceae bacterium]
MLKYKGLTAEQVEESKKLHGENIVTPPKQTSLWKLFFEKFNDPIIKILLVAAILSFTTSFFTKEFIETIGIVCAIILATGVAFWFETDAKKRFDILNKVNDDILVKVIRNGEICEISKQNIVVGDIVLIELGEEIPADGELLESISLTVNESTLTGEPSITKTTKKENFDTDATYPSNMLMRGTTVIEGRGVMRIKAVGDKTEYGRVAQQSTIESDEKTPLNLQLSRLSLFIGRIGTVLAALIFMIMVFKGLISGNMINASWIEIIQNILNYFMISVVIIVMAVPEGLPMSISLSLAMSMRKMLKTNNLVRKMHACETMGAVTVICTDKTGTLTQNQMHVNSIIIYDDNIDKSLIEDLIAVNSTVFLDKNGKVMGNPTEGALLLWLKDRGKDYFDLRNSVKIIDQIPFSTERKYMATLAEYPNGERRLYIKGAPEIVRTMCVENVNDKIISEQLCDFQNKAMRTLGFACCTCNVNTVSDAISGNILKFIGIAAIADPVREDVPDAVKNCLNAGIKIKIVTGDTPATACEIARQIGLWNDETDTDINKITGVEFAEKTDEELMEIIGGLKIMSRARPMDKQRLVRLLQQSKEVVAVTGDGTNDAPALNFAHVGLSMGSGTSVAKEASDITLLDDSFYSIATAVLWGRSLYRNIQRFVMFQLTINFAAIVIVFFGSIFGKGSELPLTVTQILWINLIMDTLAAMAFAALPPNPNVMKEKPRKKSDFIITSSMACSILLTGIIFVTILLTMLFVWENKLSSYQLSILFTTFVMLQFWNMFNVKAFASGKSAFAMLKKSKAFLLIAFCIFAGQIFIVQFGGKVFQTEPLHINDWLKITGGTALILFFGEIFRLFARKYKKLIKKTMSNNGVADYQ